MCVYSKQDRLPISWHMSKTTSPPSIQVLTEKLRTAEAARDSRYEQLLLDPEYRKLSRAVEQAQSDLEQARTARGSASRLNVSLDETTADYLRKLGDGNLSAGIREAAARLQGQRKP